MGLLSEKELYIFDLDGLIYKSNQPIPEAIQFIHALKSKNKQITYLTNNSSKTKSEYAAKLNSLGIPTREEEIYTSAYISAEFLKARYQDENVFVIGERGFEMILKEAGFHILNETNPELVDMEKIPSSVEAKIVIVGWDRFVTYNKFRCAMMLVQKGAHFYASNDDSSFPGPDSIWPGAGALVAFLQTALNQQPKKIFGKPSPMGINQILQKYGKSPLDAVMIGDRLTTDILAGNRAGVTTIFVETGIHSRKDLSRFGKDHQPTYI
ncbi:MAG: HAD-IIA family hydrolase, partial [Promethearchaeota archaeon]